MRRAIKNFIEELDKQKYSDILQASLDMGKIPQVKNRRRKTPTDELAETFAINFFPQVNKNMETYTFGPKWVLPVGDNDEMREFPSRSLVNDQLISHWEKRMVDTQNVSLKARYADLVFDFLDLKTDGKRKYQAGRVFAEAALQLIPQGKTKYDNFRQMIRRGLYISKTLKDEVLLKKYVTSLIGLAESGDYEPFVFRNLVLDKKMLKHLTDQELNRVVEIQEKYIDDVLNNNKPRPFQVNEIALDLLRYYKEASKENAAKIVARGVEKDYRASEHSNSSGLLKSNYLSELRSMYDELAQTFDFAKAEVARITAELASINEDIEADMKEISVTHEFSEDEVKQLEAFIEHLFVDDTTKEPRTISSVIQRTIINFIPKLEDERQSFDRLVKDSPVSFLFTKTFVGEDGFNTATLNGIEKDKERYFAEHFTQNIQLGDFLLRRVMIRFTDSFTEQDMVDELLKSLVMRKEDKPYIERAVKAYWSKDYLPASQAFIPMIEDGFRNLHKVNGLPIIKPNENGGYDYFSLDRFIDHPMISEVFSPIRGEDFQFYIKLVLSNLGGMGWNIRHNFAHGINKASLFNPAISHRLMHIIFCLSLIRENSKNKADGDENA